MQDYIASGNPISSNQMLTHHQLQCSAATIRNDMHQLTTNGLLYKKTPTSGSLPTILAYQHYLHHWLQQIDNKITQQLKEHLTQVLTNRYMNISTTLNQVCELICETLNTPLQLSFKQNMASKLNEEVFAKLTLTKINNQTSLFSIICENGILKQHLFHINLNDSKTFTNLETCVQILNNLLCGQTMLYIQKHLNEIFVSLQKYLQRLEIALQRYLLSLFSYETIQTKVYGVDKFLTNYDVSNSKNLKYILDLLNTNSLWDILKQEMIKNHVEIGFLPIQKEQACASVMSTTIVLANQNTVKIAMIGLNRMQYNEIYSILNWLQEALIRNDHF